MALTLYDEVAYPSHPFPQTHPLRLAVPAVLFGLAHAPMQTARILEIGCGEGGNIIPMAVSYPGASIVGFDLAPTAIEAGRAVVERLQLSNIRLEALDILQVDARLGEFDYIIVHGVYSWVPQAVREGVMRVIKECLAPEGLAFVSYNALPGCHLRQTLREMLLYHLRDVEGFEARLAGTRAFLELFIANAPDEDATTATIKVHAREMLQRDPRVLFHDELGSVYQPFYMHEFLAEAERHGLGFVAESEGSWWREELFPSSRGKAIIQAVGDDPLRMHQYLDFFTARLFRQTILGHVERKIDRSVDYRRLRDLWIAGAARPADNQPDLDSSTPVRFQLAAGAAISIDDPGLKTALFQIGQAWPCPIAGSELPDHPDINEGLLQLFTAGHLDLTAGPSPFAQVPGERPIASALARLQLAKGESALCSLDHALVSFEDEESRRFLALLDGTRTREMLTELTITPTRGSAEAGALVDLQLKGLARLGLLVA